MIAIKQKWPARFAAVLLLSALLAGCASVSSAPSSSASADSAKTDSAGEADAHYLSYEPDKAALDASFDRSSSTRILFSDDGARVYGGGAQAGSGGENGAVTITGAGTYILSGASSDASVTVYADKDDEVRLVLDGVDITNPDGAVINSMQADATRIILADGSENSVRDGGEYSGTNADGEPDATIFAKDDLSITGGGSLSVDANYLDAIVSKDILCISGGALTIDAADDGLRGTDGLIIAGGAIEVRAAGDGVKSTKDEENAKGFVRIIDGTLNIPSCYEGIEAPRIQIDGGNITINASDDGINAAANTADGSGAADGADMPDAGTANGDRIMPGGGTAPEDWTMPDGGTASEDRAMPDGGTIPEDGVMPWDGGTAPEDRVMPDGDTAPEDATPPAGGFPQRGTDDTAGGFGRRSGGTNGGFGGGTNGGMGRGMQGAADYVFLRVTGGELDITGGNDGIDVNGNIYIDGGTIKVTGPSLNMDGAIDADGTLTRSAGTIEVTGSVSVQGGVTGWEIPEESAAQSQQGFGRTRGGAGNENAT
ncbi:MAG: carbohydrate-binding domain-containing protein [Clostridiales Family XIII bacterium]|nr:carbohydrate-binding domain-containing protein [Clostridiales Family XIII bacterium]